MTKKILSVVLCIIMVLSIFTIVPFSVSAETFTNVPDYPDFDMDCYVADLFTTDGEVLNNAIQLEMNSTTPNKVIKNAIESNSELMNSMTAWQVATFQASDTSHNAVTQLGYYESIILSALNASVKSTAVKDVFDNAVLKDSKSIISSYKSILKAEYSLTFSDTTTYSALNKVEQESVLSSFEKAFKKQYPRVNDVSKFIKVFGNILNCGKSIEECMGLFTSYYHCSLVDEYLCKVVNDLYEQCPDSNVTMKTALSNISSACVSPEFADDAAFLDTVVRGFDILYGYIVDTLFDSIVASHPGGLGLMIGQAVGKSVSNILFSTDEICENYYKMCCFDEFEKLLRSVTKCEMETYKADRNTYNAECMFSAVSLMFGVNEISCDFAIDYAKTIYDKLNAGIFLDKKEYENYKATVESIRKDKQQSYQNLMTSYIFYLEADYPDIYNAYMKLVDSIENPVVQVTGVSFSKKHVTIGLEDDTFYFWNNAEVTPTNASNKTVNYVSSNESIVSIVPGNTLNIEVHKTGSATITATSDDGGFTDEFTIDVVEGHGDDGIHLEDPVTNIVYRGECGNDAYWYLHSDGTLVISGSGAIQDSYFNRYDYWKAHGSAIKTVIIEDNITSIGTYAFYQCYNITKVLLPKSVQTIRYAAFSIYDQIYGTVPGIRAYYKGNSGDWKKISISSGNLEINYAIIHYNSIDISCNQYKIIDSFKKPTCTLTGLTEGSHCSVCGNIIEEQKIIDPLGHKFDEKWTIDVQPTQESRGYKSHHCIRCKEKIDLTSIPKLVDGVRLEIDGIVYTLSEDETASVCGFSDKISSKINICQNIEYDDRNFIVKSICDNAFKSCKTIVEVHIPNSVEEIGEKSFKECLNLNSVYFGDGIKRVGYDAFDNCQALSKINVSNLKTWCDIDFIGSYMTSGYVTFKSNPLFYAHDLYLNDVLIETLDIPNTIKEIKDGVFANCESIKRVIIPSSVEIIGEAAFDECINLEKIDIPNSVKQIKSWAFDDCKSLTNIVLPMDLNEISVGTFYGCNKLDSVGIPTNVSSIGNMAFTECKNLTRVNITNIEAWCNIDFKSSASNPLLYANNLYLNGSLVRDLFIPDSITSINNYAFYACTSLINVTISKSVTSIGNMAFYDCKNLTSVTIPNSVTSIGDMAFGYYYDKDSYYYKKIDGLTTYGVKDSEAERYANDNGFTFIESGERIIGDADMDGEITIIDATFIQKYLAKLIDETKIDLIAADYDQNGIVDITDATGIQKYLAGIK